MTRDEMEEFCWNNRVPKSRMKSYVNVEIGDVLMRQRVMDIQNPQIREMALELTDARHRRQVNGVVSKIGKTKVKVYGLGKKYTLGLTPRD